MRGSREDAAAAAGSGGGEEQRDPRPISNEQIYAEHAAAHYTFKKTSGRLMNKDANGDGDVLAVIQWGDAGRCGARARAEEYIDRRAFCKRRRRRRSAAVGGERRGSGMWGGVVSGAGFCSINNARPSERANA